MSSIAFEAVSNFEREIAYWSGSKYAVAVDSCTNALFLCCKYLKVRKVSIPRFTYPGVPSAIINAGGKVKFNDEYWWGSYQLKPYPIYDSALRFKKGMYVKNSFYCISFHAKKHLPIGRGGMILTDSKKAHDWLKKARFDGRSQVPLSQDNISMVGWNCYMTPEQASRGLWLFGMIKDEELADINWTLQGYPDLSTLKAYK